MLMLRATVVTWREASLDAARGLGRSAVGLLLLLTLFPVMWLAGTLVSPLGMLGGIVLGLLNAACAGTYLATLQDALEYRRSITFSTVRANLGKYTNLTLSVAFPVWIASMVLQFLPGPIAVIVQIGIAVVCNVAPELIGRARSSGLDLLAESARWMRENALEWFLPQLLFLVPLILLQPSAISELATMFGPHFGFVSAGALALKGNWLVGVALVCAVHAMMLFRGALYLRLGTGGRRQREWRARMGG